MLQRSVYFWRRYCLGHSPYLFNSFWRRYCVGDTVLLNPGTKGKALGMLDIRWDKGEKKADTYFELLTLSERIPDSPRMTDLLFVYQQMLAAENLSEEVERESPSTGGMYAGNASCKTCHASEYAS